MIPSAEVRQTPTAVIRDRIGNRRRVRVSGRLTWRDGSGTLRFVSVTTRDVSEVDAFVECEMPASIPLYRLVHFQIERPARDFFNRLSDRVDSVLVQKPSRGRIIGITADAPRAGE